MDKEELNGMKRIISAERPEGYNLINLKIFHFDENSLFWKEFMQIKQILKATPEIRNVTFFKMKNGIFEKENFKTLKLNQFIILLKLIIYLKILTLCLS